MTQTEYQALSELAKSCVDQAFQRRQLKRLFDPSDVRALLQTHSFHKRTARWSLG